VLTMLTLLTLWSRRDFSLPPSWHIPAQEKSSNTPSRMFESPEIKQQWLPEGAAIKILVEPEGFEYMIFILIFYHQIYLFIYKKSLFLINAYHRLKIIIIKIAPLFAPL